MVVDADVDVVADVALSGKPLRPVKRQRRAIHQEDKIKPVESLLKAKSHLARNLTLGEGMAFSGVSNRSPQQIWEWVLSTLQTDMSRVTFDTWVKPAEVVSFDADIFTIGCHNDYARQWLESRLKKTIEHILSGIVGQSV